MYILHTILGIIFLIFFVSFSYMNSKPVNLVYYKWHLDNIPLYFVVIASFMGGVLITWLNEIFERLRLHMIIWKQKRKIKEYEKRLDEPDNQAGKSDDGEDEVDALPPE
ncbi:MAG: LapA family protein [Nitrospinota bacterium]|nr:LapA family protein [Nitrospinota bacterium]